MLSNPINKFIRKITVKNVNKNNKNVIVGFSTYDQDDKDSEFPVVY
jgi:hypothetical protein